MAKVLGFFKLVQNENIKSFFRIKTLIMAIVVVAAVILTASITKSTVKQPSDWKKSLKSQISSIQKENVDYQSKIDKSKDSMSKELYSTVISSNNNQLKLLNYSYEHNIPYNYYTNWKFAKEAEWITVLIMLFLIVQASNSVPSEYSMGTIKQLLIRPYKRWKVLLSKMVSILFESLVFYAFAFIITLLIGTIFFGTSGPGIDVMLKNGVPKEISIVGYCITTYCYDFIKLIVLTSLAFMISIILKNNTLSIVSTFVIIFAGSMITNFISKYSWTKFLIFPNLDLKQFMAGQTVSLKGLTMGFSAAVLLVYFIVFMGVSFGIFNKRDVI